VTSRAATAVLTGEPFLFSLGNRRRRLVFVSLRLETAVRSRQYAPARGRGVCAVMRNVFWFRDSGRRISARHSSSPRVQAVYGQSCLPTTSAPSCQWQSAPLDAEQTRSSRTHCDAGYKLSFVRSRASTRSHVVFTLARVCPRGDAAYVRMQGDTNPSPSRRKGSHRHPEPA